LLFSEVHEFGTVTAETMPVEIVASQDVPPEPAIEQKPEPVPTPTPLPDLSLLDAKPSSSTPAPPAAPDLLGRALTAVGGLAIQPRHGPARDRPRLAPPRLPALLALEVPAPLSGSPAARS